MVLSHQKHSTTSNQKKYSHTLHLTLLYLYFIKSDNFKKCAMILLFIDLFFSVYPENRTENQVFSCVPVKENFFTEINTLKLGSDAIVQ